MVSTNRAGPSRSSMAAAIVAIVAVVLLVMAGLRWLLAGLTKEVAAALVAGTATVLVSVLSVFIARHLERKREMEREIQLQKVPIYEDFVSTWLRYMFKDKPGADPMSEEELLQFFYRATQKLTIWGSDDVIRRWSRWRRLYSDDDNPPDPQAAMFQFEDLLLAIRADLGHSNSKLETGDLLGLFINDI